MATHTWILPWVSLIAFAVACLISALRFRRSPGRLDQTDTTSSPVPDELPSMAAWVVFAAAIAIAATALLKTGALVGVDYIPARGLALGALGGALVIVAGRFLHSQHPWPFEFSWAGLIVVAGRLWLTHGEVSGLAALIIGFSLAHVCLRPLDRILVWAPVVVTAAALAFTAAVGFSRAETVSDSYWADLPLVIGGCYAIALAFLPRPGSLLFRLCVPVLTTGIGALLFWSVARTLAPAGAFALGVVVSAIVGQLMVSELPSLSALSAGRCVAAALVLAGATASFLLAAGYGIGLFALGGLVTLGVLDQRREHGRVLAVVAFSTALVAYRLAVLGTGASVRSNGPGDIWDLIALGLGLLGMLIGASLLPHGKRSVAADAWSRLEYAFACIVPVWVLAYLWQPRALAGLFVGSALAPLVFAAIANDDNGRGEPAKAALTTVLIGAVLLEIMPVLADVAKPTRMIRVCLVLLLVILALARAFFAGRLNPAPAAPATDMQV